MTIGVFLPEGIEAEVCADIARRQQMGINKYGTTVAENRLSLRQWLQHAFEAIAEIDAQDERDLDDMCRAGRLPESIGTCGNVGEGEA